MSSDQVSEIVVGDQGWRRACDAIDSKGWGVPDVERRTVLVEGGGGEGWSEGRVGRGGHLGSRFARQAVDSGLRDGGCRPKAN